MRFFGRWRSLRMTGGAGVLAGLEGVCSIAALRSRKAFVGTGTWRV
ncbi:MAG: hypothetical protein HPY76_05675 [Anaerolineae bacterium]|nr:hypothetical protein [Anaerolineae bacterium]